MIKEITVNLSEIPRRGIAIGYNTGVNLTWNHTYVKPQIMVARFDQNQIPVHFSKDSKWISVDDVGCMMSSTEK